MAKKRKLKNARNLAEWLGGLSESSVKLLATLPEYECLAQALALLPTPSASGEGVFLQALLDELSKLPPQSLVSAEEDAGRFMQMSQGYTDSLLQHARNHIPNHHTPGASGFDHHADRDTQLVWIRVHAEPVFDQMEAISMTRHFHGHKRFKTFDLKGAGPTDFTWGDDAAHGLQKAIIQTLELSPDAADECEMIYFEMEEDRDGIPTLLHYLVLYHPGQMRVLREMRNRKRSLHEYIPALEATVVYDPGKKQLHVLCVRQSLAKHLADEVAEKVLQMPLSAGPVNAAYYDLSKFKRPVDLMLAESQGATIADAWVASITMALGRSSHRLTIKLSNNDNVWNILGEHFGQNNPVAMAGEIHEIELSFKVALDGERKTQSLDIAVAAEGKCSVLTTPDPRLRQVAEDLLLSLGIQSMVEPPPPGSDATQLKAELALLEIKADITDGYFLRTTGLNATNLIKAGMLTRKKPAGFITMRVSNDGEDERLQELLVRSNSTSIWAEEEFTGTRYDLTDSDPTRYGINKPFIRERLLSLFENVLTDRPLLAQDTDNNDEPLVLGHYALGGTNLPVYLVTRLCDEKHADKMDTAMRRLNCGYSIILTTTASPLRSYLGPGLVIPLQKLLLETDEGVEIDLSLAQGDILRGQPSGESVETPRLIDIDPYTAQLVGPWESSWTLNKRPWIDVVRVLVDAWNNSRQQLDLNAIRGQSNVEFRYFSDLFKPAPEWKTYIRGANRKTRPRTWELNIGLPSYYIPEATEDEDVALEDAP